MDASCMSLEEIIKRKKNISSSSYKGINRTGGKSLKKRPTAAAAARSVVTDSRSIIDVRNKIIQRNRSKIKDARDKLVQITKRSGDARLKLIKKMGQKAPSAIQLNTSLSTNPSSSRPLKKYHRRQAAPLTTNKRDRPVLYRNTVHSMEIDDIEYATPPPVLRRTVKNDIAYSNMPPLPTFPGLQGGDQDIYYQRNLRSPRLPSSQMSANHWNAADPFDCYEVPIGRPADVSEPKNLQRQIRNVGADAMPRKGILRTSRDRNLQSHQGGYSVSDEKSHLSYDMRIRLETSPDTTGATGIFSNPYIIKPKSQQMNAHGYRIVVSNLHSSVSQSDIKELFEDIGELLEARLVRPGVAEVIFSNMKDAEAAVDTYHNRQLDGQPMKCLLVNPRSSSKPTAPAIKNRSSHSSKVTKTPLEIDIDALHKVLFRRN